MNPLFTTPIRSEQDAEGFLFQLHQQGLSFHPEDRAETIIKTTTGERVFTDAEAVEVNARMDEVFGFMDDPCEFLLDLMAPATDDDRANGPQR